MKISTSELRTDRQWRAAVGLDKKRFYKLLPHFRQSYFEKYKLFLADRLVDNNVDYCIRNEEELLLFTLFSLKSGLSYDALGFVSGMDGSNAYRDQKTGLEILADSLQKLGCMPRRNFMNKDDFVEYFSSRGIDTLLIDAMEQNIQRPSDNEVQKQYYSGKKIPHA